MANTEVVKMICDFIDEQVPLADNGSRRQLITFVKDRPGHDRRYAIDSNKLRKELGWKPEESFKSGLKKTIDWYLNHKKWVERIKSGEYLSWIEKQYVL